MPLARLLLSQIPLESLVVFDRVNCSVCDSKLLPSFPTRGLDHREESLAHEGHFVVAALARCDEGQARRQRRAIDNAKSVA